MPSDGNCLFSSVLLADTAGESAQPTQMDLMIDGLELRFSANDLLREVWALSRESDYNGLDQDHIFTLKTANKNGELIQITKSEIKIVLDYLQFNELDLGTFEYLVANRCYGQQGEGAEIIAMSLILDKIISVHEPGQPVKEFANDFFAFEGRVTETLKIIYIPSPNRASGHYQTLVPENLDFQVSIFFNLTYLTNFDLKNLVHRAILGLLTKQQSLLA